MADKFYFTFNNIEQQYKEVIRSGYEIIRCVDYAHIKNQNLKIRTLVNRIDIDYSVKKAERLADIFNRLGIKGSFFIRLHAPEYNPFSFENYRILKGLSKNGHEIGYHSEVVDESVIWDENPVFCLERDIAVINRMFDIKIKGIASHNGMTGKNNLDFWEKKKPQDFGLLYEAYDNQPQFNLFNESFYISDSEWTQWKCYNKGKLLLNDTRSLIEHIRDENHPLIYLLIHSDTFFDNHFYE